jgi:phosphatidate cytidylyltransferase
VSAEARNSSGDSSSEGIVEPVSDRRPTGPTRSRNLPVAIATALILLALIAVCFALGPDAFFVLAAAVILLAVFEAFDVARLGGHNVVRSFGVIAGLAMILTAYLWRPAYLSGVLALALLVATFLAMRPSRGPHPAEDVAWSIFILAWVGGGGSGAVSILRVEDIGLTLLVTAVLLVAIDDIGAYFVGTTFGRHKLAPSISPAKSWEGLIGGLFAALVAGLAAGTLLDELTLIEGMGLGLVAAAFAPLGDLLESMVKRENGVKDSGRLLPGHGGMLDRLDAILFTAPFAYLYLRVVVL